MVDLELDDAIIELGFYKLKDIFCSPHKVCTHNVHRFYVVYIPLSHWILLCDHERVFFIVLS